MATRITIIIGGLFLFISLFTFLESSFFFVTSKPTEAIVTDLISSPGTCSIGGRYSRRTVQATVFNALSEYKINDSIFVLKHYSGKECNGYRNLKYEKGDRVSIRYLGFDPDIARIDSFSHFWGIPLAAFLLGIFIIGIIPFLPSIFSWQYYDADSQRGVRWPGILIAVLILTILLIVPTQVPSLSRVLIFYEIVLISAITLLSTLIVTYLSGKGGTKFHTFFPPFALLLNVENSFFFFLATFCAKLSKIDGQITKDEIETIRKIIEEKLLLREREIEYFIAVFRQSVNSIWSVSFIRSLFYYRYRRVPEAQGLLVDSLVSLSKADKNVSEEEEKFVIETARMFCLEETVYKALYHQDDETRGSFGKDKLDFYYRVLGCKPGDTLGVVKTAFRNLSKLHHPDRAIALGLPVNLVNAAKERFQKINEAYQKIIDASV